MKSNKVISNIDYKNRSITSGEKITIVIADDHLVVRQGLRTFLELQPMFQIIAEASSGEEAITACQEHVPDVVLMDLLMPPGMGGIEATRQVKTISPRTQVIILTSFHEDAQILPAIEAGALSYLLKDVKPMELRDAICKAARGEVVLHPHVASRIMNALQNSSKAEKKTLLTELSKREIEVLRLIAEGITNAEIADKLFISEKTVKSHVSNILSKLHLSDRTQAAVYAWRTGIVEDQ
ncbi:MAG: response regulator transcription factor [Blastocatellia bacterium]|nr:response regulator transcription factor [Blastocatellia bacterium]